MIMNGHTFMADISCSHEHEKYRSKKLKVSQIKTRFFNTREPLNHKLFNTINSFQSQIIMNGVTNNVTKVFVLSDNTSEDVARATIEKGLQKQPFYICDLDKAYERIKHFKDMMPRVQIFYAMKSNDTEMFLKLAISQGLGFDCGSPGEIYKLSKLNVSPNSMIYAMPTKSSEQMTYARNSGVQYTTFDTSYELKKIKTYWPDARLLIRIRVDSINRINLGKKFGCDFETEAVSLLEEAASLGLKVAGVAFHVGCVCETVESYAVGLQQVKMLFDHEERAGRKMYIVDIGGGFHSDETNKIDKVSKIINENLDKLFPDPNVKVVAEPGRYLSDGAFTLYCSISNVRRVKENGKPVAMIYLNDGVYGTMRYAERWHKIYKFMRSAEVSSDALEEVILWGPSCDALDHVREKFTVILPPLTPLDWLVFGNHGSYTITFATDFSSLEKPRIRYVISTNLWEMVKDHAIFSDTEFVLNPDISTPLPSTLPPKPSMNESYQHSFPTLH